MGGISPRREHREQPPCCSAGNAGQRSSGCSAKGPPEGAVSVRPRRDPEPLQSLRLLRSFHLKINSTPTYVTHLGLAKIKSTIRRKQATNTHLSLPVKKVPQSNHKKPQNNTKEKLVTLVLYCVEYMVAGFSLVLGGDSKEYQLISIFHAYDNIDSLIPEIWQEDSSLWLSQISILCHKFNTLNIQSSLS